MRVLHVLRHAKSDWGNPRLADHDRPLNRRGRAASRLIAAHVAGWPVDLVVCSSATRTRQTAAAILPGLGCPIRYERAVYRADAEELIEILAALPDGVATAMLVGHNPGVEDLTVALCGQSPRYPTAALGSIELAIDGWDGARPRCGTLVAHVVPADLAAAG